MRGTGHCPDFSVLKNHAFALALSRDGSIYHCPRQVVGWNYLVGEHSPKDGVNRTQKPVTEIRKGNWPRSNWRSRSQTEDRTSFQKALFEGRRYHRSSARFAKNWSIARLRTADWSFPSGSPSYLLTGLQRNPPQPQLTIRD